MQENSAIYVGNCEPGIKYETLSSKMIPSYENIRMM